MNRATTIRLPGVYFEVEPPASSELLPRMDVAAFVGFAASGPLHIPVVIEDIARFKDIFGEDLELAWDHESGGMARAALAPTVRAFFGNGGVRCWVVRIADPKRAVTNRFPLTGLVSAVEAMSVFRLAVGHARSAGSWSDRLRVEAVSGAGGVFAARVLDEHAMNFDLVGSRGSVTKGDLLRIPFQDDGLVLFLTVASVERAGSASGREARLNVKGLSQYWFASDPKDMSIESAVGASIIGSEVDTAIPIRFDSSQPVRCIDVATGSYQVELEISYAEAPREGDLLRLRFDDGGTERHLLLPVATVVAGSEESPPVATITVTGKGGLWPLKPGDGLARFHSHFGSPGNRIGVNAERLTFDLLVWNGQELAATIRDLTFHPDHPRYWGNLPNDEDLFRLTEGRTAISPGSQLAVDALSPRFPIAGPRVSASDRDAESATYLPIGLHRSPDAELARGTSDTHADDSALSRNGLENFTEDCFVDLDLVDSGTATLVSDAFFKLYVREQPLAGLHSLLSIDEVTLVSLPDAGLRGWRRQRVSLPTRVVPSPTLGLAYTPGETAALLTWDAPVDDALYELQESVDPLFTRTTLHYRGHLRRIMIPASNDCPDYLYYRVRALLGDLRSPWSNTAILYLQLSVFDACLRRPPGSPVLRQTPGSSPPDDEIFVEWSAVKGTDQYVVETATDPMFVDASQVTTLARWMRIAWRQEDPMFVRVRSDGVGWVGPWSNALGYEPPARHALAMIAQESYEPSVLLAVQRALLRFCAARGDVLALLALPAHYRTQECLAHVAMLTPDTKDDTGIDIVEKGVRRIRPLNFDEERALGYGALYHPWVAVRTGMGRADEAVRYIPPDGAACGLIAARTIKRGAWIAPANDVLRGIVGLSPTFDREAWLRFYQSGINIIRNDPRGYLLLSADTLGTDDSLRPINVRRLMILLRRLAMREGESYVFRPNTENFRRQVRQHFEELLGFLYQRGAFAPGDPTSAFQVVADESINLPSSVDLGRCIVELRVAPSRPLEFISVRLIQSGSGGFILAEK